MTVSLDDVRHLIADKLGCAPPEPGDRIVEDLRAESLDIMSILAEIEERFGVVIDDDEVEDLRTVDELHRRIDAG